MFLQCVFLVVSLNFLQVFTLSDIKYVGCYDATSASTFSFKSEADPLTWKMCTILCKKQLTIYAGIDSNNSSCLCGDYIAELSTALGDSRCDECHKDPLHYCGGQDAMSVYQLRLKTQTPIKLLLATKQGIEFFQYLRSTDNNIEQKSFVQVLPLSKGASSVAYDSLNHDIYYVSGNKIFKLSYISVLMKYYPPTIWTEPVCSEVRDISLDWVRKRIFWTCYYSSSYIYNANLDGSDIRKANSHISSIKYVSVEPFAQRIFYNSGTLLCVSNHSHESYDTLKEYMFKEVLQFAIDIQRETVYAIGSFSASTKKYLVSFNYNFTVFKVLYGGPELTNSFALDVVNGTVIWGTADNRIKNVTFYKGSVSSEYELKDIEVIYFSTGINNITAMKIYTPDAHLPSKRYLCREKNCSHSCILISPQLVRCSCPESLTILSSDGKTCMDFPEQESWSEEDVNETKTDLAVEFTELTPLTVDNIELTPEDREAGKHPVYNVIIVCVFACLIIFTLVQLYLLMLIKKSNGNFSIRFSKRPESEEPTYSEPGRGICNDYS